MDVVLSGFLSVSDRALLRIFGREETKQWSTGSVEGSDSASSASGLMVDGHPSNHSTNIFDRARLRRFPGAPATLSSNCGTAAVIPTSPRNVTVEITKKIKIFIGKGSRNKAFVSYGSLESLQKTVKSPICFTHSLEEHSAASLKHARLAHAQ